MGHNLYNNLLESDVSQYENKSTRGDNILDLIFSTNDGLVSNVNSGPESSISYHWIVSFKINLEVYKEHLSEEIIFMCRNANFEKPKKILADTDWSIVENETDANKSWKKIL